MHLRDIINKPIESVFGQVDGSDSLQGSSSTPATATLTDGPGVSTIQVPTVKESTRGNSRDSTKYTDFKGRLTQENIGVVRLRHMQDLLNRLFSLLCALLM